MEQKKAITIAKIKEFYPISSSQIDNLEKFVNSLLSFNKQLNLIGKSTEAEIWDRHILDSAQLIKYIDNLNLTGADFGSGAGLPGVVLSILGLKKIYLIEKSFRKCQFLEQTKQFSDNQIIIKQQDIKEIDSDFAPDLLLSRALAPLNDLLSMVKPFIKDDSYCLFLKGKNWEKELDIAKKNNQFIYRPIALKGVLKSGSADGFKKLKSQEIPKILSCEIFLSLTSLESRLIMIKCFKY